MRGSVRIPVVRATAEELASHELALDVVAKAVGGRVLFREP